MTTFQGLLTGLHGLLPGLSVRELSFIYVGCGLNPSPLPIGMEWVTRTKIKSEFWSGGWWCSPATPQYGRMMIFTNNKFEENLCYIARSQREKNGNRSKFFLYCWLLNSKNLFVGIPEYRIRRNKKIIKELLQFVCFPTSIPTYSKLVLSGSFHRKLCENHSPCVKLCLTWVAITDIFDSCQDPHTAI